MPDIREPILQGDRKINLPTKFTNYDGIDPAIVPDGSFMGSMTGALGQFDRHAIVGAASWMNGVAPKTPLQMRLCHAANEHGARVWVAMT